MVIGTIGHWKKKISLNHLGDPFPTQTLLNSLGKAREGGECINIVTSLQKFLKIPQGGGSIFAHLFWRGAGKFPETPCRPTQIGWVSSLWPQNKLGLGRAKLKFSLVGVVDVLVGVQTSPGWWGLDCTRIMLVSTQVEVLVKVWVELCKMITTPYPCVDVWRKSLTLPKLISTSWTLVEDI